MRLSIFFFFLALSKEAQIPTEAFRNFDWSTYMMLTMQTWDGRIQFNQFIGQVV